MRILFIGGPGNISESTIRACLEKGDEIAVFTRSSSSSDGLKHQIRFIRGDRDCEGILTTAIGQFRPDIVVDTICFTPEQARNTIFAARGHTGRVIFLSTVDVYGYPLSRIPMKEIDERCAPVSPYAADKVVCETLFRQAADDGAFGLTIVRPAYSFGPAFVLDLFSRSGGLDLVARMRAGRALVVPGDGSGLMHASVAWNTGRMIAEIMSSDISTGKSYTCAHEHAITQDDYYRLFARAVGIEPVLVHVPVDLLLPLEGRIIPDNLLSELTRFQLCFSVDAFKRDFPSFRWEQSLEEGAALYLKAHDKLGDYPAAKDDWQDAIVRAWNACACEFGNRLP